jgi:hypothetical protein
MLLFMLLLSLYAEGDTKKVVFDLTIGDVDRFEQVVIKGTESHSTHYSQELKEYKPVFIIHGDAYRFFLKDLKGTPYEGDKKLAERRKELGSRLASLVENYDVTFEVCSAGMRKKQIPFENLYPFVTPIFTSTAGLIDWQEKGYAYIMAK